MSNSIFPPNLPILHSYVTPIKRSTSPVIPPFHIPVVTISIQDADNMYNMWDHCLISLIERGLLDSHGDPSIPSACFVDLENAARAFALESRGEYRDWSGAVILDRISSPGEDGPHLRRLLARFLLGHCRFRGHQGDVVAYRTMHQGFDLGPAAVHPVNEWVELIDFWNGV